MILSGSEIAATLQDQLKLKCASLSGRKPHLAVLLVGSFGPSQTYVAAKKKACLDVGIDFSLHTFEENVSLATVMATIKTLNHSAQVDGILVQSPLPAHIPYETVIASLDPSKDVDGFHPINMGKLLLGIEGGFIPCTPLGCKVLVEKSHIPLKGKHVVIVGRSNIVGKPLAALLLQKGVDATVTIAHSQTPSLSALTKQADILVAALGKPRFITAEMVKQGAVVIDVGINRVENASLSKGYTIVGDVDFESVAPKCHAITPVPKGVGPMTVAMLLHNTLKSYEISHRSSATS